MFVKVLATLAVMGMATTANASTWSSFWGGSMGWTSNYSHSYQLSSARWSPRQRGRGWNRGGSIFFKKPIIKIKKIDPRPTPGADVPLPAAGFLLLGGLGGIALMKRRKKS